MVTLVIVIMMMYYVKNAMYFNQLNISPNKLKFRYASDILPSLLNGDEPPHVNAIHSPCNSYMNVNLVYTLITAALLHCDGTQNNV